ncbi:beta-glucosidase, partial [Tremellales sp. Uapishka_1]
MSNFDLDRSFLEASIPDLLKKLTLDEKISLLAGRDFWNTVSVPRLNVPTIKVTDGPNGARGDSFFNMTPASALPNATAIGATFSKELVHTAAGLLGEETKARNATCLLAPTINIQRSPLGGRAFESFSEDPTHSGLIAASYVNGLQATGVSATIKHFVANDQEHERNGEDSIIDARTLREIYLRPFQIAQAQSKPWAYMTSYNKLNGTHASENPWLLDTLLRKEWRHDGLIMSDWFGTYSVSESINAGLNLEMPGAPRWRAAGLVKHLIVAHKIDPRQLDKVVGEVLVWVQKLVKLNPDLVYAKPSPERTRTDAQAADAKILRRLGAESIVVLKNENNILPVTKSKVAVIGPNAKARVLTGGGSAQLASSWSVSPWEGLEANKPDGVELSYSIGAVTSKFLPPLDENFTAIDGSPGFSISHYSIVDGKQAKKPFSEGKRSNSEMFMGDFQIPGLGTDWFTKAEAVFLSPITGEYELGLSVTGQGWLWVDDKLLIDLSQPTPKSTAFFGMGSLEIRKTFKVVKGKVGDEPIVHAVLTPLQKYKIKLLHDSRVPVTANEDPSPFNNVGVRLGAFPALDFDQAIKDAADTASKADIAIVVAGLNADWESEGYDRPDLSLPLRSDELITAVAKANPNTIVVIQAGSAVSMPWLDQVRGVVYAWYGGNETGNAIADIIYGAANPSGRLPISLPKREVDIPANLNYKSARTKIHYHEGIWVGYKHYNARGIEPLYPFGHGLSYTTFDYSDLKITTPPAPGSTAADWKLGVSVKVTNTGNVKGSHSVHFYASPPPETSTGLHHPQWTLQAFEKVYELEPGSSETVEVVLDKYAVSHWDELWKTWRAELGEWTIRVGVNAQEMYGAATFRIDEDLEWTGL